jgi:hypothetical protein
VLRYAEHLFSLVCSACYFTSHGGDESIVEEPNWYQQKSLGFLVMTLLSQIELMMDEKKHTHGKRCYVQQSSKLRGHLPSFANTAEVRIYGSFLPIAVCFLFTLSESFSFNFRRALRCVQLGWEGIWGLLDHVASCF